MTQTWKLFLTGLAAGLIFVVLCGINLDSQGVYQDEVFQATGSFAYRGGPPVAAARFLGLPVLNNPYVGALKTAVYGMYLRLGGTFSDVSWRWLGVAFVASGLLFFPFLVNGGGAGTPILGLPALALFGLLICTDASLLLSSRHDYGPTALALLLRLLWIAVYLRSYRTGSPSLRNSAILGFLVAIAIFDKLSSAVMLLPLVLILILDLPRRTLRHWIAAAAGGLCGTIPLIVANLVSYRESHTLISLSEISTGRTHSLRQFIESFPQNYLALGSASYLRHSLFGRDVPWSDLRLEILVMGALLVITGLISFPNWRRNIYFRLSSLFIVLYLATGIGIYLLPRVTSFHHYIIVSPFQYAAFALAAEGLWRWHSEKCRPRFRRALSGMFVASVALVLGIHCFWTAVSIRDLLARRTGPYWDHAYTDIALFAAGRKDRAMFVAAAWGLAGQIYCYGQGEPDLVREPFWNYRGPEDLRVLLQTVGKPTFYVLTPVKDFSGSEHSPVTTAIEKDAARLDGWAEAPVETELTRLSRVVRIRKYIRR